MLIKHGGDRTVLQRSVQTKSDFKNSGITGARISNKTHVHRVTKASLQADLDPPLDAHMPLCDFLFYILTALIKHSDTYKYTV